MGGLNRTKMIYTESEYFEEFYPKSWGDFREEYNLDMYRKQPRVSGCTWMDYYELGYCLAPDENNIMKVREIHRPEIIERFFIKCGSLEDESKIAFFIQPAFQSKTGEYYASVTLTKMESNLDLYKVFITGNDDSSYTKHFTSLRVAQECIEMIKYFGINHIEDKEYEFFTN